MIHIDDTPRKSLVTCSMSIDLSTFFFLKHTHTHTHTHTYSWRKKKNTITKNHLYYSKCTTSTCHRTDASQITSTYFPTRCGNSFSCTKRPFWFRDAGSGTIYIPTLAIHNGAVRELICAHSPPGLNFWDLLMCVASGVTNLTVGRRHASKWCRSFVKKRSVDCGALARLGSN